ncbi:hypothetical protein ACAW74_25655 [Fibrella sp. WM1]|uniref:hypothetical protein n=1 Tax=Fibrella musci TaxID=3242485 RepID=UPI003520E495
MRTEAQIIAEQDAVQATIPELATLDTNSSTGFFPYLKKMFALLTMALEALIDQLGADLTAELDAKQVGSLTWYVAQAKAFQYGERTQVIGGRVGYATVDATKQIVKQSAAVEEGGRLTIKAVKAGGGGLIPLTADEQTAFAEYMGLVKYAGVQLSILSLFAEELGLDINVKIDRQVLAPNGALLKDSARFPVLEGIATYLAALPFDSVLSWTLLTDYMQTVPGVVDFVIVQARSRAGQANDPINGLTWVPFVGSYTSRSGHMRLVAAESTIRYA